MIVSPIRVLQFAARFRKISAIALRTAINRRNIMRMVRLRQSFIPGHAQMTPDFLPNWQ
jgi:hypothetical protein